MSRSDNGADGRALRHQRPGELSLDWGTEPLAQVLRKEVARGDGSTVAGVPTSSGEPVRGFRRSDAGNEAEWAPYNWQRDARSRRPSGAGIGAFARQLMALERTRMRRRTPQGSVARQGRKPPGLRRKRN